MAISLEVAEHLKPERSATFIKDICDAADVVLFSAATKYQGGDGHINEQRLSYWVELFKQQGYGMIDVVRPQIWNNTNIPVWYRENIVVFYNLKSETISKAATEAMIKYDEKLVDVIHPDLFEKRSKIVLNPAFRLLHKIKTAVMAPKNK